MKGKSSDGSSHYLGRRILSVKRNIGIAIVGVLALLVAALFLVPRHVDWNKFTPEIAELVYEETGKNLFIDGDIEVTLLPRLTFRASGIRLEEPTFKTESRLASVKELTGDISLIPLLFGKLEVQSFVVSEPTVWLEVSKAGDTNWRIYVIRPADDADESDSPVSPLPLSINLLKNTRIQDGRVHFLDQRTGQHVTAVDLTTGISQPNIVSPLLIEGGTTVNKKAITWTFGVNTLADLLGGEDAEISGALKTELLDVNTALNLDLAPPFSIHGDLAVKASSVSAIATWLNRPLEGKAGAVDIKATFKRGDDQKIVVSAMIDGDDLNATLSGDMNLQADIPVAHLKLEGKILDFTRYLPAPVASKLAPSISHKNNQLNLATAGKKFNQPLVLSFLKEMRGTVALNLEKIVTHRITMGPVVASGALEKGNLTGKIEKLSLYGGGLTGGVTLKEAGGDTNLTIDAEMVKFPFDTIGKGLALDTLPFAGVGNGSLTLVTEGQTIFQLAQNARFDLDMDLAPPKEQVREAKVTAAKVNLTRPKKRGPAELKGNVTYKGRKVGLSGNITPKGAAESPTSMDFKVRLQSDLAVLELNGNRDLSESPRTQLIADLNVPSAQDLVNWLEISDVRKSKDAIADPLNVTTKLQLQNQVLNIESLDFSGPVIKAKATGQFDQRKETPLLNLTIKGEKLDIDTLLTLLPARREKPRNEKSADKDSDEFVGFLSDKALDLSGLQTFDMNTNIQVKEVIFDEQVLGPIVMAGRLKEGHMKTTITAFQFYGADITGELAFDTKPALYSFNARFDIAEWKGDIVPMTRKRVVTLAKGTTGQGEFKAKGRSPRDLVASTIGKMKLSLPGISFTNEQIPEFSNSTLEIRIPEKPDTLELSTTSTVLIGKKKVEMPLQATLKTGRLVSLVVDSNMPVDLQGSLGEMKISMIGDIANIRTNPRANLKTSLDVPSLEAFQTLFKDLPDIKPVTAKVTLHADRKSFSLTDLTAQVGASDVAGQVSVNLVDSPQDIQATLFSDLIDLSVFQSDAPLEDTTEKSGAIAPTDDGTYVFKEKPLPFEYLDQFNVNASIDIKKLQTSKMTALNNVKAGILVKDKVLTIDPLRMERGNGNLETTLTYNTAKAVPILALKATFHDLDIVVLSENVHLVLNSYSDITATGDSPRKLASSLNGRSDWISRKGTVNSGFLGLLSFGAGDLFSTILGAGKNTGFDCLVFRFSSRDGVVTPDVAMVDTGDLVVAGDGTINLKNEAIQLTIGSNARNISLADLVAQILVTGTLKSPKVVPDPLTGTAKLSAGLLGLINPVNAVNTVFGSDILGSNKPPCAVAFNQVADTKAPADLTLTAEQSTNSGLIGTTAKGAGNILKSIGSGIENLFGAGKE
jgi:AsmA family protein